MHSSHVAIEMTQHQLAGVSYTRKSTNWKSTEILKMVGIAGSSVLCMCDDAVFLLALLSFSRNVNHKGRGVHEDEGNTSRACLEASCSSPKSRPGMVIDRMAVEMPQASM